MNFAIIRVAKLKTFGSLGASGQHTFRERQTDNADPARTHLNTSQGAQNTADLVASVKDRLPAKYRKDAVLCAEYLITASPEWFEKASVDQQERFFRESRAWLEKRHGADNVVCTNVQRDEKTPHMAAYVVPRLADGRLSAKEFFGGRAKLSKMQSEFWRDVGAKHGMQRGVEGSKAQHKTIKTFYAELTKNPGLEPPLPPPEPSVMDVVKGKARADQLEYAAQLAKHADFVGRAANVAKLGHENRIQQAKAINHARGEAAALEAAQKENQLLRKTIGEKDRVIEGLKSETSRLQTELSKAKKLAVIFLQELKKYMPTQVWERFSTQHQRDRDKGGVSR